MSAQIIPIADATALETAWSEYAAHMAQAAGDQGLWTDREWMQRRAVLQRRFDRLYLMQGSGR